jgi:serine/threonine-protein kinase RsbT
VRTESKRVLVPITEAGDVITARQKGRELAIQAGFSSSDLVRIATAISELARNILLYAGDGEIHLSIVEEEDRVAIVIVARDEGAGIQDIEKALQDGFSTSGGLGLGLPGTRRLMDEFQIVSERGKGTTVTVKKWKTRREAL